MADKTEKKSAKPSAKQAPVAKKAATDRPTASVTKASWRSRLLAVLGYGAWVMLVFAVSQVLLMVILELLNWAGIYDYSQADTVFILAVGAAAYVIMLIITIGVPYWTRRQLTTWRELGLARLMEWRDIGLALAGIVTYFILTAVLLLAAKEFMPWVDIEQTQDIGINMLRPGLEIAMAFLLLVVAAPVVEELLFRGYLYGKLRGRGVPFWVTALVVSLLFGIAHLQWNVGVDTFALSLVMCATREITGTIWPSILMHMMKNSLAFYFLFVNPMALQGVAG